MRACCRSYPQQSMGHKLCDITRLLACFSFPFAVSGGEGAKECVCVLEMVCSSWWGRGLTPPNAAPTVLKLASKLQGNDHLSSSVAAAKWKAVQERFKDLQNRSGNPLHSMVWIPIGSHLCLS